MKYDRFFNIHIPKTGGTHFRENVLSSINEILKINGIKTNPAREEDTAHWCWFEPFITDKTYIYTTLRDPAERIVSQFCWQAKAAVLYTNTPYTLNDINKKSFYKWLDNSDNLYKNVQAKNLIYYNQNHTPYKVSNNLTWNYMDIPRKDHFMFTEDFKNFTIDKEVLNKNVKRINLINKTEDMTTINGQEKIINKILKDLNIDYRINNFTADNFLDSDLVAVNPISKNLFSELSNKEINNLYEYQEIDSELYFSDIYTKY